MLFVCFRLSVPNVWNISFKCFRFFFFHSGEWAFCTGKKDYFCPMIQHYGKYCSKRVLENCKWMWVYISWDMSYFSRGTIDGLQLHIGARKLNRLYVVWLLYFIDKRYILHVRCSEKIWSIVFIVIAFKVTTMLPQDLFKDNMRFCDTSFRKWCDRVG